MGVNIKNHETERLIREFAEKKGLGQTEAVTVAMREALDRFDAAAKRKGLADRLMAISRETAPLMKDFDMDEALYGENGLYDRETGLPK